MFNVYIFQYATLKLHDRRINLLISCLCMRKSIRPITKSDCVSQLCPLISFISDCHLVKWQGVNMAAWRAAKLVSWTCSRADFKYGHKKERHCRKNANRLDSQDMLRSPLLQLIPGHWCTDHFLLRLHLRRHENRNAVEELKTDALSWQARLQFVWNCRCRSSRVRRPFGRASCLLHHVGSSLLAVSTFFFSLFLSSFLFFFFWPTSGELTWKCASGRGMQTKFKVNHCQRATGIFAHIHINAVHPHLPPPFVQILRKLICCYHTKARAKRDVWGEIKWQATVGSRQQGPAKRTSWACTFLMHLAPARLLNWLNFRCRVSTTHNWANCQAPQKLAPQVALDCWLWFFPHVFQIQLCVEGRRHHTHSCANAIQNLSCEWLLKSQSTSSELPLFLIFFPAFLRLV